MEKAEVRFRLCALKNKGFERFSLSDITLLFFSVSVKSFFIFFTLAHQIPRGRSLENRFYVSIIFSPIFLGFLWFHTWSMIRFNFYGEKRKESNSNSKQRTEIVPTVARTELHEYDWFQLILPDFSWIFVDPGSIPLIPDQTRLFFCRCYFLITYGVCKKRKYCNRMSEKKKNSLLLTNVYDFYVLEDKTSQKKFPSVRLDLRTYVDFSCGHNNVWRS